jgi:hypothetical protein
MKIKKDMQDVRIRTVPRKLVNRLKAVLAIRDQSMVEWFQQEAAKTADEGKK